MLATQVRVATSLLLTGEAEAADTEYVRQTVAAKFPNMIPPGFGDLHYKGHNDNHAHKVQHSQKSAPCNLDSSAYAVAKNKDFVFDTIFYMQTVPHMFTEWVVIAHAFSTEISKCQGCYTFFSIALLSGG